VVGAQYEIDIEHQTATDDPEKFLLARALINNMPTPPPSRKWLSESLVPQGEMRLRQRKEFYGTVKIFLGPLSWVSSSFLFSSEMLRNGKMIGE